MTGQRGRALLAAALAAVLCGSIALVSGVLGPVEDDTVAARFGLRPAHPPSEVAVVAVDDVTFADTRKQWPLPRSYYGRAIKQLRKAGAKAVVLDVQFTEESEDPAEDLALYDSLPLLRGAILATTETDELGRTFVLGGDANLARVGARAAAANLPDARGGVISRFTPTAGGIETIAAASARNAGRPLPLAAFEDEGAWIDYRGRPGTVPMLSFSRVMNGDFDARVVRGRIIVVGASTPTVQDVHPTPTTGHGALMAGPEIQANAIWTALHGLPLRSAPGWLDALFVLLASLAAPLLAARLRVLVSTLAVPVVALALAAAAQALFAAGLVVTLTPALLALGVGGLTAVVASHLGESRERRRVSALADVLDAEVRDRTRELSEAQLEIIQRLGHAVEYRDQETGDHIERMSADCHRLALAVGMSEEEAELVRRASALHDVGKIGVPDAILRKPGKLDPEEFAVMQTHAALGGQILAGSSTPLIRLAETIALTHHERWDGTGYPSGLAGEAIPIEGRIASICDVFDALTSERPYKSAWPVPEALAELRAQRGRQFDPKLVDYFLAIKREAGHFEPPRAANPPALAPESHDAPAA